MPQLTLNVPALIAEFREFHVSRDHADALSLARFRDAQDDAEHGPGPCYNEGCDLQDCREYRARMATMFVGGMPGAIA